MIEEPIALPPTDFALRTAQWSVVAGLVGWSTLLPLVVHAALGLGSWVVPMAVIATQAVLVPFAAGTSLAAWQRSFGSNNPTMARSMATIGGGIVTSLVVVIAIATFLTLLLGSGR